jgi:hypothetical protein
MSRPGYEPRIGGIIEDETGWWQIVAVEEELVGDSLQVVGVTLMDRTGAERDVSIGNLGPVSYL